MTKRQDWARKRNWDKRMLKGIETSLWRILQGKEIITFDEESALTIAHARVSEVLQSWNVRNMRSRTKFLKEDAR